MAREFVTCLTLVELHYFFYSIDFMISELLQLRFFVYWMGETNLMDSVFRQYLLFYIKDVSN